MTDSATINQPAAAANAARSKDKPFKAPLTDKAMKTEGDIEAGHLSAEELAGEIRPRLINARDSRAYRQNQAEKNEAANDEINARETDLVNEGRDALAGSTILDPDKMREESLESSLADIEMHTKAGKERRAATREAIAADRLERGDSTPVPGGAPANGGKKK